MKKSIIFLIFIVFLAFILALFLFTGNKNNTLFSLTETKKKAIKTKKDACIEWKNLEKRAKFKSFTVTEIDECTSENGTPLAFNFPTINFGSSNVHSPLSSNVYDQNYFDQRVKILRAIVIQTNYLIKTLIIYEDNFKSNISNKEQNLVKGIFKQFEQLNKILKSFNEVIIKINKHENEVTKIHSLMITKSNELIDEFKKLNNVIESFRKAQEKATIDKIKKLIKEFEPTDSNNLTPKEKAKKTLTTELEKALQHIKNILQYPGIYTDDIIDSLINELNLNSYKIDADNENEATILNSETIINNLDNETLSELESLIDKVSQLVILIKNDSDNTAFLEVLKDNAAKINMVTLLEKLLTSSNSELLKESDIMNLFDENDDENDQITLYKSYFANSDLSSWNVLNQEKRNKIVQLNKDLSSTISNIFDSKINEILDQLSTKANDLKEIKNLIEELNGENVEIWNNNDDVHSSQEIYDDIVQYFNLEEVRPSLSKKDELKIHLETFKNDNFNFLSEVKNWSSTTLNQVLNNAREALKNAHQIIFNNSKNETLKKVTDAITEVEQKLSSATTEIENFDSLLPVPQESTEPYVSTINNKKIEAKQAQEIIQNVLDELKEIKAKISAVNFETSNWNKNFNDDFLMDGSDNIIATKNTLVNLQIEKINELYEQAQAAKKEAFINHFESDKSALIKEIDDLITTNADAFDGIQSKIDILDNFLESIDELNADDYPKIAIIRNIKTAIETKKDEINSILTSQLPDAKIEVSEQEFDEDNWETKFNWGLVFGNDDHNIESTTNEIKSKFTSLNGEYAKVNLLGFAVYKRKILNELKTIFKSADSTKTDISAKINQIKEWLSSSVVESIGVKYTEKWETIKAQKEELKKILADKKSTIKELNSLTDSSANPSFNFEDSDQYFTTFSEKIDNWERAIQTVVTVVEEAYKIAENIKIIEDIKTKIDSLILTFEAEIMKVREFDEIKANILISNSDNSINNINLDEEKMAIETLIEALKSIKMEIQEITLNNQDSVTSIKAKLTTANNLSIQSAVTLDVAEINKNLLIAKLIYFNLQKTATLIEINDAIVVAEKKLYIADQQVTDFIDLFWLLEALTIADNTHHQVLENKISEIIVISDQIKTIIDDQLKQKQWLIENKIFNGENWNIENEFLDDDLLSNITKNIATKIKEINQIHTNAAVSLVNNYSEEFAREKAEFLALIDYLINQPLTELIEADSKEAKITEVLTAYSEDSFMEDLLPIVKQEHMVILEQYKETIIQQKDIIKELNVDDNIRVYLTNLKNAVNGLEYNSENSAQIFITKLNILFETLKNKKKLRPIIDAWTNIDVAYHQFTNSRKTMTKIFFDRELNKKIIKIQKTFETEHDLNLIKAYETATETYEIFSEVLFWSGIVNALQISDEMPEHWSSSVDQIMNKKNEIKQSENDLTSIIRKHSHFFYGHWNAQFNGLYSTFQEEQKQRYINIFKKIDDASIFLKNIFENEDDSDNAIQTMINNQLKGKSSDGLNQPNDWQKEIFGLIADEIKQTYKKKRDTKMLPKLMEIKEYLNNYHMNSDYKNILSNFIQEIKTIETQMLTQNNDIDQTIIDLYSVLGTVALFENPTENDFSTLRESLINNANEISEYTETFDSHYNNFVTERSKSKRLKLLLNDFISNSNILPAHKNVLKLWLNENDLTTEIAIEILEGIFFQGNNIPLESGKIELNWNIYGSGPVPKYKIYYWKERLTIANVAGNPWKKLKNKNKNPSFEGEITTTDKRGSVIVKNLIPGKWYTFALQKINSSRQKFTIYNFGSVYIHDGIKIVTMKKNVPGAENIPINHDRLVEAIFVNEAIPSEICVEPCVSSRLDELFFPIDLDETSTVVTNTYEFDNYIFDNVDIINMGFSYNVRAIAEERFLLFQNRFPLTDSVKIPLFVVSGGNQPENYCTEAVWTYSENKDLDDESLSVGSQFYQACNLIAANMIKRHADYADNHLIIVGSSIEEDANRPGEVLKDHWISTHYSWDSAGSEYLGTSLGASYVSKIAAEIKRRAPQYSNLEIINLIFETAYDAGVLGTDPVYGRGILNPLAIFDELTERGF